MLKLNCKTCGVVYEKPEDFKIWNDNHKEKWGRPNIFFEWSLMYCDKCRRKKENEALKRLPEVIKALSDNFKNDE